VGELRHLRRLHQTWERQPVYFITACVADRRPVLANEAARLILHEEWSAMRGRHGWAVGSYVVMPDHVHFFVSPVLGLGKPLSVAVGKRKEWTAKRILPSGRGPRKLWQAEFSDHVLRSTESRAEKWAYVRENPVRAGLVARAEDWPYSGSVDFA